jgi:hypothetical protein
MLKLSHILSLRTRIADKPELIASLEAACPRAVIGAVPAATALHLALAHQMGERLELYRGMDAEFGVDDLTMPETLAAVVKEKPEGEHVESGTVLD